MSEGYMKHGALEEIHTPREGNIIWKLQCPNTNRACGKQVLVVSLEGLWENMSPSVPLELVFQRQQRNHMSFSFHVHWCLTWVSNVTEPDDQIS